MKGWSNFIHCPALLLLQGNLIHQTGGILEIECTTCVLFLVQQASRSRQPLC